MDRMITVNGEALPYTLTRKKVKNLNLRVKRDGTVWVSANRLVPAGEIDAFVAGRAEWIAAARLRAAALLPAAPLPDCPYTDADCDAALRPFVEKYLPLFAASIGGELTIRYRTMKTRWGVCCPAKKRITLNRRLLSKSAAAQEYVVLHELVHFDHPDHQKGFYRELSALMPDYAQRRVELRRL